MLDLPRLEERVFGTLLGDGDLGLAAAVGLDQQRRLILALLLEPRPLGRIFRGQLLPVDAATTGRQRPAGRPGRSAATRSPPARRRRLAPWATRIASSRTCGRLAGLLVDEGDALLLVLGDQRPQPARARPARPPCPRRSRIRAALSPPLRELRSGQASSSAVRLRGSPPAHERFSAAVPCAVQVPQPGGVIQHRHGAWRSSTASAGSTDSADRHGLSFGGHTGSPSVVHDVP